MKKKKPSTYSSNQWHKASLLYTINNCLALSIFREVFSKKIKIFTLPKYNYIRSFILSRPNSYTKELSLSI